MFAKDKYSSKQFLGRRRREKRQLYWEMPSVRWSIIILILGVIFVAISFFCRNCTQWFSGFFQSVGTGLITGWVLYFLSNSREITQNKVARTIKSLTPLVECGKRIYQTRLCTEYPKVYSCNGTIDFEEQMYTALSEAILYVQYFEQCDNAIISREELDVGAVKRSIRELEDGISGEVRQEIAVANISKIIELIAPSLEKIERKLKNAEIQQSQQRYPI